MKQIKGGVAPPGGGGQIVPCSATADCYSGTPLTCHGYSVGSIGGCNATDAGYGGIHTDGQVSCIEPDVDSNGFFTWIITTENCQPPS